MTRSRFQKFPTHIRETEDGITYPVAFTEDIFTGDNQSIRRIFSKIGFELPLTCAVLVDSGLVARNRHLIKQILRHFQKEKEYLHLPEAPFVISGGEAIKNSNKMKDEVASLCEKGFLTRETMVFVLGGGAFIDAAGTALGQALGGIPFAAIPSSTLGQCAAGVGCCRFMNQGDQKNHAATQAPPKAVFVDFGLLNSLSSEHFLSGMAEAFKMALASDSEFFEILCRKARKIYQREPATIEKVLNKTARINLTIAHPAHEGLPDQRLLGCWSGWWLESVSGFMLPHGHALSVGLALDAWLAKEAGVLSGETFERLISALVKCGLPVWNRYLETKKPDGLLQLTEGLAHWENAHGKGKGLIIPCEGGSVTRLTPLPSNAMLEEAVENLRQLSKRDPDDQNRRMFVVSPRSRSRKPASHHHA